MKRYIGIPVLASIAILTLGAAPARAERGHAVRLAGVGQLLAGGRRDQVRVDVGPQSRGGSRLPSRRDRCAQHEPQPALRWAANRPRRAIPRRRRRSRAVCVCHRATRRACRHAFQRRLHRQRRWRRTGAVKRQVGISQRRPVGQQPEQAGRRALARLQRRHVQNRRAVVDGAKRRRPLPAQQRRHDLHEEDLHHGHRRKDHREADVGPIGRGGAVRVGQNARVAGHT